MIGARLRRIEDRALVAGEGRFVDDIDLPGMLHVAFVRSPHAHALVRGIDAAAARRLAGVHAVLTLDDLRPVLAQERLPRNPRATRQPEGSTPFVLAASEVAFVGEAVALVAARSRAVAEDAAALVAVAYDVLPAVADCRAAIAADAKRARRDTESNVLARFNVAFGDIDAAFRGAHEVVDCELFQHRGGGHPIEGRGIAVEWRHTERALSVWSSTQLAHELFQAIADTLGLDENRLRVATPDVGGGFGPKYCVYPEEVAAAAASLRLGRSLKWIEDRREHFLSAIQERDQYWSMAMALDRDGRIRGIRGRLLHDQGAYALKDVNLPYNSATSVTGPYVVPSFALDVVIATTNKGPASSVRGAGYPQSCFAMERLMDRAARALGLDRAEIRRRNLIPPEKMPYEKPLRARSGAAIALDSGDYPGCQAEILAAAEWDRFPARQRAARAEGRHIGIGLAHAVKGTGRGPFESGIVRIAPSGRISVFTGAALMGQGLATALAQICAGVLGVTPEQVSVIAGDTSVVPLGLGGFASRQLVTAGSSVLIAAQAVADKARKLASHILEADEKDLELADGEVRVVGVRQHAIRLGELARILRGAPGYGFPPGVEPGLEANRSFLTDALAYANACHVAQVEVDIETGGVAILGYWAIQDSGVLINPLIVDGQVQGGIAHGIGNALYEFMGYDDAAQPVTTTLAEYLLPTAPALPMFQTRYRQSPSPVNPLGAKGVGEVGTIPAAAAVLAAVEDALAPFGVMIDETPLTPPRLVALIAAARNKPRQEEA
ncbi:MAG TPA: xanthine dehydrogenase family protein molybdopterin-binding subunit [Stellaceae bacterium]|nr:xanthine dehydrogenase family protein molybdopterin-binding subunit [Stellaceae bacterium]